MTYQNDSFIAEHWNDQLYERSETVSEIQTCHECEGTRGWSDCCGVTVEDGICTDCKKVTKTVTCHVCNGNGEIEY